MGGGSTHHQHITNPIHSPTSAGAPGGLGYESSIDTGTPACVDPGNWVPKWDGVCGHGSGGLGGVGGPLHVTHGRVLPRPNPIPTRSGAWSMRETLRQERRRCWSRKLKWSSGDEMGRGVWAWVGWVWLLQIVVDTYRKVGAMVERLEKESAAQSQAMVV